MPTVVPRRFDGLGGLRPARVVAALTAVWLCWAGGLAFGQSAAPPPPPPPVNARPDDTSDAPPPLDLSDLGTAPGGAAGVGAALPTLQGDTTWGGRPAFPHVIAPALVATPSGLPILNDARNRLAFSGGIPPNFLVDATDSPATLSSADLVVGMLGLRVGANTYIPFGAMLLSSPIIGYNMINWAENGSVLPRDRVFFDYRHFDAVGSVEIINLTGPDPANGHPNAYYQRQQLNPLSVDRYVFGFEKTFGEGRWSLEARLPFQGQAKSVQTFHPGQSLVEAFDIGNFGLALKRYLVQGERWNVAGGMGMQLPTAAGTDLTYETRVLLNWNNVTANLHEIINIKQSNETVWLNPFLGVSYDAQRWLFAQGIVQLCVPLNPSRATLTAAVPDGSIDLYGRPVFDFNAAPLHETTNLAMAFQTLFRANLSVGCWLYRNPCRPLRSLAAIFEVNDTNTLGNRYHATVVNLGPQLAATIGKTEVGAGLLVPVSNNTAYQSEFTLRINRNF